MAKKQKSRRQHPPEFKAEAIKLVLEQGLSRAEASRDLGIHPTALGRWLNAEEQVEWPDEQAALAAVSGHIHGSYHQRRRPSALGQLSPVDSEPAHWAVAVAARA